MMGISQITTTVYECDRCGRSSKERGWFDADVDVRFWMGGGPAHREEKEWTREYWLCDRCADKLQRFLANTADVGGTPIEKKED